MITPLGSVHTYLSPVELECHVIPLHESVGRSCRGSQGHTLPSVLVMVCLKYLLIALSSESDHQLLPYLVGKRLTCTILNPGVLRINRDELKQR
jgi:hypothetical protein